jgi:UPF0288 family protein (methanogenesis marker protein 3)
LKDIEITVFHLLFIVFMETHTLVFLPYGNYFCSFFVIFSLCHFDAEYLYIIIAKHWHVTEYHRGGMEDEKYRDIIGRRQC